VIESNQDENNPQQQQMLNGQYIKMSINGVSTIFGLVHGEFTSDLVVILQNGCIASFYWQKR
jgi:hypothetical protein